MSLSRTQVSIIKTLYPDKTLPLQVHTGDRSILEIKGLIGVIDQGIVLTDKGRKLVENINSATEAYINRDNIRGGGKHNDK